MKIKQGYVYHIKEDYFKIVKDDKLMKNHEGSASRPNYFCLQIDDSEIMWFIPMSSKVDKYKAIIEDKVNKYKKCDTIVIGNYRGRQHAFLIQNMFPITLKYIDHIDTVNGQALQVPSETRRIIAEKVNRIFRLKENGINLIYPNVDRIKALLLSDLLK